MFPNFSTALTLTLFSSIFVVPAHAYTWPNPLLDELESQVYDRRGYRERGLTSGVTPCNFFILGAQKGRTNAADWLRSVSCFCAPLVEGSEIDGGDDYGGLRG